MARPTDQSDPSVSLFCLALLASAPTPREAVVALAMRLLALRSR